MTSPLRALTSCNRFSEVKDPLAKEYVLAIKAIYEETNEDPTYHWSPGDTLPITTRIHQNDPYGPPHLREDFALLIAGNEGVQPWRESQWSNYKLRTKVPLRTSLPSVTIIEPLQAEAGFSSQVWLGQLAHPETSVPTKVIIKIFDEIKYIGDGYNKPPVEFPDYTWILPGEAFVREMWAFKALEALQGTVIPHSYGFYVITRKGYPMPCHIMEFIEGKSLETVLEEKGGFNAATCGDLYTNLFRAAEALNHYRVAWGNISKGNMLILGEDPNVPVFFDFGLASPLKFSGGLEYAKNINPVYGVLKWAALGEDTLGPKKAVFRAWVNSVRGGDEDWAKVVNAILV